MHAAGGNIAAIRRPAWTRSPGRALEPGSADRQAAARD